MKIVYCIGALYKAGGVERVLINKANYLAEVAGYQITILIAKQNNLAICYPISQKVKIIDVAIDVSNSMFSRIPVLGFFYNIRQLKKVYQSIVNEIKPNIIINVERGYEDFILPKILPNIPKIRESHSSHEAVCLMDTANKTLKSKIVGKAFSYLYNNQLKKYDHIILLTTRDQKFRNYLKNTTVIPNTIPSFNGSISQLKNSKAISVGRLDQFKNFKDQILVWSKIIKTHPEWTLHIYGEGPERNNLEKLIKSLVLEKHVFLEGVSSEIASKYEESSLFIFTSLAEGFGMVLVEAMQFGLPVISYDCPCGPKEIIEEGKDGYLIEVSDLNTLEKRILDLIENEKLRSSMSVHAIEKNKRYLPEQIMPQWIRLFEEMRNGK